MERADVGDATAKDALFASPYDELHRLTESHIRRSHGSSRWARRTCCTRAYLDLNSRSAVGFPDRPGFFKYASRAMRGLIIDYVRRKRVQKRGGELTFTWQEGGFQLATTTRRRLAKNHYTRSCRHMRP